MRMVEKLFRSSNICMRDSLLPCTLMCGRARSMLHHKAYPLVLYHVLVVHGPCPATIIQRLKNESASYSPHTCDDAEWALANYVDLSGQIISLGAWREVVVFTGMSVLLR